MQPCQSFKPKKLENTTRKILENSKTPKKSSQINKIATQGGAVAVGGVPKKNIVAKGIVTRHTTFCVWASHTFVHHARVLHALLGLCHRCLICNFCEDVGLF